MPLKWYNYTRLWHYKRYTHKINKNENKQRLSKWNIKITKSNKKYIKSVLQFKQVRMSRNAFT